MTNEDEFDYASEYAYGGYTGPYGAPLPPPPACVCLADLAYCSWRDLVDHVVKNYGVNRANVECFDVIVAYESVGASGCDSSSLFVLRSHAAPFDYYVVAGGHCSCNGFEGQWNPERVTLKYLKSSYFDPSLGGYDDEAGTNRDAIHRAIVALPDEGNRG